MKQVLLHKASEPRGRLFDGEAQRHCELILDRTPRQLEVACHRTACQLAKPRAQILSLMFVNLSDHGLRCTPRDSTRPAGLRQAQAAEGRS